MSGDPPVLHPDALAGQTVLVTGASGGIGGATAKCFADAGARLILVDRQAPDLADNRFLSARSTPLALGCDTADRAGVDALAKECEPVHVVVDAAGIWPRDDWMSPGWDEAFEQVMHVNVRGPINLVRAFMPGMIQRRYGRIVLCGSIAGWTGGSMSSPHYVAAKGGVHALVRWFAQQCVGHQVCVNAVAPGPVRTGMTADAAYDLDAIPLRRLANPGEVAAMIAFLGSPAASYICGTVIDVNGACYMR